MRILLIGPTAVGKTAHSIELAESLNAEIISADSRQCYRFLDIGTAKPSADELQRVIHHNISILDPDEPVNAADFYRRATGWEEEIQARGKRILYTGGSTLHLQSIIKPLDDVPEANRDNLKQLAERSEREGIETLYKELMKVDPVYAGRMDGLNTQRILRALDVWMQTGKPFSSYHSGGDSFRLPRETFVFGLNRNRKELYKRIDRRVDRMFEQGFLGEVESLLKMGYTRRDPALNSVGYRDAIKYLDNKKSREAVIRDMKTVTRRYAKRQLTWFRRWSFVNWIDVDIKSAPEVVKIITDKLAANRQNH